VLKLEEVEKPRPKDGEVLVRIHRTTVSRADCEIRRFDSLRGSGSHPSGVRRREARVRILGQEFAGEWSPR